MIIIIIIIIIMIKITPQRTFTMYTSNNLMFLTALITMMITQIL